MANRIPEYRPQVNPNFGGGGSVTADTGEAGRSLAGFGQALSEAGQRIQRRDEMVDESRTAVNASKLDAQWNLQWQQAKQQADPSDPEYHNLAQNFLQNVVEPGLDELGKNINTDAGRRNYEETAQKLRSRMSILTHGDQSELDGLAAANDAATIVNTTSTKLFNDPSSFDGAVQDAQDERLRLQRAGMTVEKSDEWLRRTQSQYAQSAVRGAAHLNQDKAQADLDSGRYDKYLTGEQKSELTDYITRQKNAATEKQRSDEIEARRQQEEADKKAASDILHKSVIIGSDGRARVKPDAWKALDAIQDPGEWKSTYEALQRYQKSGEEDGERIKTDPHVLTSMISRLPGGPDANANPLTDIEARQAIGHGLTIENYDFLHGQLAGKEPPNPMATRMLTQTLDDVKNKMGAGPSANNVLGDDKAVDHYTAWLNQFLKEYQAALTSSKNPLDVLDRTSRDYLPSLKNPMAWTQPTTFPGTLIVPRGQGTAPAKPATAKRKSLDEIFGSR